MAQQEAEQQLRDILLLFQQHVKQTLDSAHSPHLSATQRNHIRHVAQHVFHHLAGPVRKTWLKALNAHLASLPPPSSSPDASASPPSASLLPDLATAQSVLTQHHTELSSTLQHAIDSIRTNNLYLVPENTTDVPHSTSTTTAAATPTKRRKTATQQQQQAVGGGVGVVDDDEASRVVETRAEVDNVLDELNELLKKEQLELTELHTFLAAHPSQHDTASADVDVHASKGGAAAAVISAGGEAGKAGSAVAAGGVVSGGSTSNSQLSSPSSGHSKQVSAGLAKRLNRSAAM